jgi:hypothetical protein
MLSMTPRARISTAFETDGIGDIGFVAPNGELRVRNLAPAERARTGFALYWPPIP